MFFEEDLPNPKKEHKKKANGFLMYLLEFRRLQKDLGNPMEMSEAQIQAGENWQVCKCRLKQFIRSNSFIWLQKMSGAERDRYNPKSAQPTATRPDRKKLYTSFGVSFDELDRQKEDEMRRIRNMELTVEEMLQNALEVDSKWSLVYEVNF